MTIFLPSCPPKTDLVLRLMQAGDLHAVLAIQRACYSPEIIESESVIRRRLAAAGETAWVAEQAGTVCAYLVGYRSRLGRLTALGGDFEPLAEGDSLYLHDLAVAAGASGCGAGRALIEHALAYGRSAGLAFSALVSVQESRDFWRKRGYSEVADLGDEQRQRLASYAGTSYYMVRKLAS